jgi:peptide/nickel transport system substrate-binding protein
MSERNYWQRLRHHKLGRRQLLQASAKAGVGAAGLALVGCGDDDDDAAATPAPSTPAEQADQATDQAADQVVADAPGAADEPDEPAAPAPGQPRQGGTFRVGLPADAAHLDWAQRVDIMQARNTNLVYSKLFQPERGNKAPVVGPSVAAAWPETPSSTETIVSLRQDVYFQDVPPVNGRQLVAEDLVASLDHIRTAEVKAFTYAFEPVERIVPVDQFTARYDLESPFLALPFYWADWYAGSILAKEVLDEDGDLKSRAIGSGPFIMNEWRKDVGIFLERNPNYFEKPQPYLDKFEILVVPDASARLAAFRGGDHQYLEQFPTVLADSVRSAVDGVQEFAIDGWHQGMVLQSQRWTDVRMRQAISKSIDRDALNDAIYLGFGKPSGPIAPMWGELARPPETFENWRFDPQGAQQLMDAAGYADGLSLEVKIGPYGGDYEAASEAVIATTRNIGFDLTIGTPVYADWIGDVYTNNEFDLALVPFLRGSLDTQTYAYYHSTSGGNFIGVKDDVLDGLAEGLRAATDDEVYRDALLGFEDYLAEQCYYILDVQPPFWYFAQPEVRDMDPGIVNYFWSNLMQVVWMDT